MKKNIIILFLALPFVMNGQMTYVPDDAFERRLINLGFDKEPLNDSVPTKNIDTITNLRLYYSSIEDLTGIEDFKALKSLDCLGILLKKVDISHNTALELLQFSGGSLTELDVSQNTALKYLDCNQNQLTSLDVSHNPKLVRLVSIDNQITNIDLSKNQSLQILCIPLNHLTNLDVSQNPDLQILSFYSNNIKTLDLSQNKNLTALNCSSNNLTNLNLKNGNNKILSSIDATGNPNLHCIQVDDSIKAVSNSFYSYWLKDKVAHYSENCGYTGVEDITFENNTVTLSPNPAMDYIEISVGVLRAVPDNVVIYDILGVLQLPRPDGHPFGLEGEVLRIDVSYLLPGVYFVRVGDVVRKFVKY